jgi:hypothetical protein
MEAKIEFIRVSNSRSDCAIGKGKFSNVVCGDGFFSSLESLRLFVCV